VGDDEPKRGVRLDLAGFGSASGRMAPNMIGNVNRVEARCLSGLNDLGQL
jgi:hypothetical protein